jgi:CRISPR system Cascade subunit CasD
VIGMRDYLLFRLYAPLSSWGDIAVGEIRPSWPYPTKSAILGLLAAAKGIRREQHEMLDALRGGYGVAVRTLTAGAPLRDYHTIQRPAASKASRRRNAPLKTYATRRAELNPDDPALINCTQSSREYFVDAVHDIAVWAAAEQAPWPLEALRDSLARPVFCLYLGRKSCPPALPLGPRVVTAATLREAFAAGVTEPTLLPKLGDSAVAHVYWDALPEGESGYTEVHRTIRRDDPIDRTRWLFLEREECYATEALEDNA